MGRKKDGARPLLVALAFLLVVLAAIIISSQRQGSALEDPDLSALYQSAVADAKAVAAYKIYPGLVAITSSNDELVRDPAGRVLFVTWTSWAGYDGSAGSDVPLSREVWVTASPQLADYCKALPAGANRTLWLESLTGVPPGSGKTRFVEMYASERDVFRPCPDNEITDSACGLEFPSDATAEYRAWFQGLNASSYGADGYPWTRLGYTYNWGFAGSRDYFSRVGLSEFVIRRGATVGVRSVSSLEQYCA
jgi:hypothetical protein